MAAKAVPAEFGTVYWFKKVMGSNIARTRGLDNGLSEVAKQNYYARRGLAFRQAKWQRAVTNMASRGGMGVHIVGGRAGTASQGTKFVGDRVPRCSGWPAATAVRVARPSSPRARSSTLCPMNLTLDGGTRGPL
jgi:hypothetical protein